MQSVGGTRSILAVPALMVFQTATLLSQSVVAPSATRAVAIYTKFLEPPSGVSVEHLKAEMDAILGPVLRLEWYSLEQATGQDVKADIVVVKFQGRCGSNAQPPPLRRGGPLGWTNVVDGEILPFAGVNCDRIRELMEGNLAASPDTERDQLFGRAMARVLAHEMYHFLAKTARHAVDGVAKARYSAADLAGPCLRFEEEQLRQVRTSQFQHVSKAHQDAGGPAGGG